MRPEDVIVSQLSQWLRLQFPGVIFRFDLAAGARLSIGMAMRNKKINPFNGYPDLFIAEPRGKYYGLFIEIKKDGTKLKKKNGGWINDHIKAQYSMLLCLSRKGYVAEFGIGFDDCKNIIERYLK